jgi:hypothetical protein
MRRAGEGKRPTDWNTAIDLNPPQTFTGDYWTNFSGTVVATGPSMTLWLDGQTGSTGLNKAQCFDAVTVTCLGAPPPADSQPAGGANQVVDIERGTGGTVHAAVALVNWVVL